MRALEARIEEMSRELVKHSGQSLTACLGTVALIVVGPDGWFVEERPGGARIKLVPSPQRTSDAD